MLGQGSLIKGVLALAIMALALAGCSSNTKKYEQRDRLANSSGLYCDFINGDKHKEAEIELNMSMAKRCDPEKPFSITGYRNASEVHGLTYCCSMKRTASQPKVAPAVDKKSIPAQDNKSGPESE